MQHVFTVLLGMLVFAMVFAIAQSFGVATTVSNGDISTLGAIIGLAIALDGSMNREGGY